MKKNRILIEVEAVADQDVLITIGRNDYRIEDPAKLVELAHDLDVVLAKVGKGCKTNARCAKIIRLRYLSAKIFTQRDIAKRMGISTCRVGQLEDRAIRRLRMFGARMGLATGRSQLLPVGSLAPNY